MAGPAADHRLIHVITPGDHYSPRTGSAIPTVVHGLSSAMPRGGPRPAVLVARGTYPDRYESAEIVEYEQRRAGRFDRYTDLVTSRLVQRRPAARATYRAALVDQAAWDPAVVLVHNGPQGVGAVDSARHMAVLYAHNELLRSYTQREAGRALDGADRIVCVSEFLAGRTADRLPAGLRERVTVVRNGVDTAFFHPPTTWERRERLEVLFVGRMLRDKGADVLLDALILLDRHDVHATIVGSAGFDPHAAPTPYESEVATTVARLGDRVTRVPFVPRSEVARLLRAADVVVVPSRWPDPCPLTVLEGMASGAAVIASSIGGIPEQLGNAGIAATPGDPRALADALAALADDATALSRSRAAALAHALAHDWHHSLATLRRVLEA